MKKYLGIILAFILVFSAVPVYANSTVTIDIFHTNDVHSRVEGKGIIGYAKIATVVEAARAKNPGKVLLLDAGDTFHGQTIATISRGESIVRILNAMKYDLMVPGNHDFNYGLDRMLELRDKMNFPLISSNIIYNKNAFPVLPSYKILEVAGVKIGVFGITSPETAYKTNPKNVENVTFTDPIERAKTMVSILAPKTDVIVALSHIGVDTGTSPNSYDILKEVEGIDLYIDGHSIHCLKTARWLVIHFSCRQENMDKTLDMFS